MNKHTWKLFPFDWLLLFTVVYVAMRCLQTAYHFPVSSGTLLLWILCLTGLFCAVFRLPHAWAYALAGLLLLPVGYLLYRRTLNTSVLQLIRSILSTLSGAYAWVDRLISVQPPAADVDLTPAFLLLSAALAFFVCASVVWLRTALPATLFCVAAIVPCFFLIDTPPGAVFLVLLTTGLLVLAFSQGVRSRAPEDAPLATALALVPAVLIVGLTLLFFPEKDYQPPVKLEDVTARLADAGEKIGSDLQISGVNTQRVDLRSLGPKQQRTYEALRVTVDGDPEDLLYLRGMAYEDFDGASWRVHSDSGASDGALLTHAWATDRTAAVAITTRSMRSVRYTPGYLVAPDVSTVLDYYVPNEPRTLSYEFQMYLPAPGGYSFAPPGAEKLALLDADAQENCTYLPPETEQKLQEIAAENGLLSAASTEKLAKNVVSFVRQSAVYDLSPPRVPANTDFCSWFLTEAGSGYCVHFATAAAAMLRAVGIPARYVEGYVTGVTAGEETVVEERQAHAWVEAYLPGEGWRQFDPTPSDGVNDSAVPRSGEQESDTNATTEETGGDTPAEPTEPTSASDGTQQPTLPDAPQQNPSDVQTPKAPMPAWVWVLLGLAGLLLAALALRLLRRANWNKRVAGAQGNRLALLYWKRYTQLCKALRQAPDGDCEALAKKAKFSQYQAQPEELAVLSDAMRRQEQAIRTLPLPQRLWYNYWLVFKQ